MKFEVCWKSKRESQGLWVCGGDWGSLPTLGSPAWWSWVGVWCGSLRVWLGGLLEARRSRDGCDLPVGRKTQCCWNFFFPFLFGLIVNEFLVMVARPWWWWLGLDGGGLAVLRWDRLWFIYLWFFFGSVWPWKLVLFVGFVVGRFGTNEIWEI